MDDFVVIGKIKGVYGRKGAIKVLPLTDFPKRFDQLTRIFLMQEDKRLEKDFQVEHVTYTNRFVGLKLAEVNSVQEAWELINFLVVIPINERMSLEADSYYISDLIGLKVVDVAGNHLGVLVNVIDTAAAAVMAIEKKGQEFLLPILKETVRKVDLQAHVITVYPEDYLDGN